MKRLLFFVYLLIVSSCSSTYDVNHYRNKGFREQKPFIQKIEINKNRI